MINCTSTEFARLAAGVCPDCKHRGFKLGPHSDHCVDIECANRHCAARFQLAMRGWSTLLWAKRLPLGEDASNWMVDHGRQARSVRR